MDPRDAFITQLMSDFDEIAPGHLMGDYYRTYLTKLSAAQMSEVVRKIENGEEYLPLVNPNLSGVVLSVDRNLKIGKKWGWNFFPRIWITDPSDPDVTYLSNPKYLVIPLPVRRQAQTSEAGLSTPLDNNQQDELTGQVTGVSKSSAMTAPEVQILGNEQLYNTLEEFLKPRGGDNKAYQAMEKSIIQTGTGTLAEARAAGTRAKSADTLSVLMKYGAHLGNTL